MTTSTEGHSMVAKANRAFFLIAEISGYTQFFTDVELDHAFDIVTDLMATVVTNLRPRFHLTRIEGDAALLHAVASDIDGSAFQDLFEAAYFAFRRRLRVIRQDSPCECGACNRVRHLDVRFICHAGEIVRRQVGSREELAGDDAWLVHRLLQNTVQERIGAHAYALYSDACLQALDIVGEETKLIEHDEPLHHAGTVRCWIQDLQNAWSDEIERPGVDVTREGAAFVLETDVAAPRLTVWEHLTVPRLRQPWSGAESVDETTLDGRRGLGTITVIKSGTTSVSEEILDWRACDLLTTRRDLDPSLVQTMELRENAPNTTHLEIRVAPLSSEFTSDQINALQDALSSEIARLRQEVEAVHPAPAIIDEPALPVSAQRFLTEPADEL